MKITHWNRNLLVLVVLVLSSLPARADTNLQMPEDVFPELRQILANAVQQSPRMVANNLELLIADGALTQAKSGLYPSISGLYQPSKTQDKRENQATTLKTSRTYYSLLLTQPLYHWGERQNSARIGEIRREIATENFQEAYRLLAQEIRVSYVAMIVHKISRNNAVYNLGLAEDALVLAEERLLKKELSEGAIFQIRITAEQARLDMETTEWNLAVAKQDFATLTGQSELPDAQIPDTIPQLKHSDAAKHLLAGFLAQNEPNTVAARNARRQILIDDLNYKNQRTRLRPKLSFVLGMTQDEQSYTSNLEQKYGVQSQYAGLQVTWNIFDGFATRGAVSSALAQKRLAEHYYNRLTEKLAADAQKAARMVELAQRQLSISEQLLDSAANFLAYTKENIKRGQSSEADVNGALVAYNNMQISTNSARSACLLRIAEFVSLITVDPVLQNLPSTGNIHNR